MDRSALIAKLHLEEFQVPPDQDYTISLFSPEDALGVSRLTHSIYGDQHPFDYVYDPEEVARLYASGTQYALVAKSKTGDVLGMIGVYQCAPWPHLYELAQLMILKNQRKKGLAKELFLRGMDILPRVSKARAVFGEAVCTHTFSQRMCLDTGMLPCGLALDAIPSRAYSDSAAQEDRTTLILQTKPLWTEAQAVCLPDDYRPTFEQFCRITNLRREIIQRREESPTSSHLKILHFPQAEYLKIWVHAAGQDLSARIAECERTVGSRGIVQIIFHLNDGGVLTGIENARARGYFFGGFLPFWFEADGLMLQRRKDEPSFSWFKLFNDAARYLIDLAQDDARQARGRRATWGGQTSPGQE
jgi:hypothetical protein